MSSSRQASVVIVSSQVQAHNERLVVAADRVVDPREIDIDVHDIEVGFIH